MLIDDSNVYSAPSVHALEAWNAEREAAARVQISAAEAEKVSEKANKLATSDEAIRKRKERERELAEREVSFLQAMVVCITPLYSRLILNTPTGKFHS